VTIGGSCWGGNRLSVDTVRTDGRLAALRPLVAEPLLDVPDPRLKTLQGTPALFRAVRVRIDELGGSRRRSCSSHRLAGMLLRMVAPSPSAAAAPDLRAWVPCGS